ncbi:flagellar hook-associated protein FlgL [Providencia vermicola]|uniref:Flagellar hook-associated protein FlgL n=1 Tax=Providencia stuartii TaxID=588 RepID=A0AAI9I1J1_PROST|nr:MULTISPECIES: flagellar hook-associated protein FlgL [Providencia]ELR5044446.1 flagellar hook-associated protein FlgL [Providencia rettgeri]ELR5036917.1 flagellar hook-associated protein FlgL [Providencia stuartii]ELR5120394.1 flagellar hook-associated protein FlgL [Providencia stuartii]ELR5142939.1 flagellar hook-associated protein FlgL [Providencia stuartii]ELR5292004.1 flagellar hook-associated protein FlgL [Providencia stuartii]
MRLSTNMIYHQRLQDMNNAQARWMDAGSQLASGKRVSKPSDDPQASSQAVRINQSENRNQQYVASRGFAKTGMLLQMSILTQMTDITTQIDTTIIQASNQASLSDSDRLSLAEQLSGLKDQLVALGNTTDGNGRYIFAGFKSDKPPFEVDASGEVIYKGGDKAIMQNVSSDREMTTYFTGAQVFTTDSTNTVEVFKRLNAGIAALKTPQENATQAEREAAQKALGEANSAIKSALDKISNIEAKQGLQLQEIDKLDFLADTRSIQNSQRMSNLLDTNWTGATSDYYKEMAMFQASQDIFKDLNSMSLFGGR